MRRRSSKTLALVPARVATTQMSGSWHTCAAESTRLSSRLRLFSIRAWHGRCSCWIMIPITNSKVPRILCVVLALGCGGRASAISDTGSGNSAGSTGGYPQAAGQGGSGDAAGTGSGGAAGAPSGGTAGSPPGGSGGDVGSGGGCFKAQCDLLQAPTCKDATTVTTYTQPSPGDAPCGVSCISIAVDTLCGLGRHCEQSTGIGAACVLDSSGDCASGQMRYQVYASMLIASNASCTTDTDCAIVSPANQCGLDCGIAVSASKTTPVVEGLGGYAKSNCASCSPLPVPACRQFRAACMPVIFSPSGPAIGVCTALPPPP